MKTMARMDLERIEGGGCGSFLLLALLGAATGNVGLMGFGATLAVYGCVFQ